MSGTYVGVRYDKQSMEHISELAHEYGLPISVSMGAMHSTIVYSRKFFPFYKKRLEIDCPAVVERFEIWPCDGKNVLVLVLDSAAMIARHEGLLEKGMTHEYDNYIPHITIAYDVGDFKLPENVNDFPKFFIRANLEYVETLKEDWGK